MPCRVSVACCRSGADGRSCTAETADPSAGGDLYSAAPGRSGTTARSTGVVSSEPPAFPGRPPLPSLIPPLPPSRLQCRRPSAETRRLFHRSGDTAWADYTRPRRSGVLVRSASDARRKRWSSCCSPRCEIKPFPRLSGTGPKSFARLDAIFTEWGGTRNADDNMARCLTPRRAEATQAPLLVRQESDDLAASAALVCYPRAESK